VSGTNVNNVTDKDIEQLQSRMTLVSGVNLEPEPLPFYHLGLLSYCNGTYKGNTSIVTGCTPPSLSFGFRFADILRHQHSSKNISLPDIVTNAVYIVREYTQWTSLAYIATCLSTVLVLITGFMKGQSHLGAVLTAMSATVSNIYLSIRNTWVREPILRSSEDSSDVQHLGICHSSLYVRNPE
jgi:hypothetical protein